MCGRVYTAFELAEMDMSLFDRGPISLRAIEPNYNLAPTQSIPVLYFNQNHSDFELKEGLWQLIPPYIQDPATFKFATFNARGEDIFTKASYKKPILYSRCEIIVSGFFEWHYYSKTKKQPYAISDPNDGITRLAGIYTINNGQLTTSIITVQANQLMADIHNIHQVNPKKSARMPLKLDDKHRQAWHNPDVNNRQMLESLINHYHQNNGVKWEAYQVDSSIGNTRNNRAELLQPINNKILSN